MDRFECAAQPALTAAADAMDEVVAAYMLDGLALPVRSKTPKGEHMVWPRPGP